MFELFNIPGVEDKQFKIRALGRNVSGKIRSEILKFFSAYFLSNKDDYNKIMLSLKEYIVINGPKCPPNRFKYGKGFSEIWEVKAFNCGVRLFGFFDKDGKTLILNNHYLKSKGNNSTLQNQAFQKCRDAKIAFYKEIYNDSK
jgi:hypothetical protein